MVKMKTSNTEQQANEQAMEITAKPIDNYEAPAEVKADRVKAIYELTELSDDEKEELVMNRIKKIVTMEIPKVIPTLIVYQNGSAPPVQGIVNVDSRQIREAWDFYKVNVKNPDSGNFVEMLSKCTGQRPIVYQRVVQINLL